MRRRRAGRLLIVVGLEARVGLKLRLHGLEVETLLLLVHLLRELTESSFA